MGRLLANPEADGGTARFCAVVTRGTSDQAYARSGGVSLRTVVVDADIIRRAWKRSAPALLKPTPPSVLGTMSDMALACRA